MHQPITHNSVKPIQDQARCDVQCQFVIQWQSPKDHYMKPSEWTEEGSWKSSWYGNVFNPSDPQQVKRSEIEAHKALDRGSKSKHKRRVLKVTVRHEVILENWEPIWDVNYHLAPL